MSFGEAVDTLDHATIPECIIVFSVAACASLFVVNHATQSTSSYTRARISRFSQIPIAKESNRKYLQVSWM